VLAAIAEAGYEGTELGPPGYLGREETLRARLEARGLALAGGYIPLRFSQPRRWEDDLAAMARTLDLFDAADGAEARAVLADAGSPERLANPGRARIKTSLGLDDAGWRRLADGIARAVELARTRGYEPVFHHHTGTFVEAPWEIERMLELTDVGLLLDTGHLALGGGDPVEALALWGARVSHVHVKDVRLEVLERALADRADMTEVWRRGVFCELGTGDVELRAFFAALGKLGYDGWLVVEQDRIPAPGEDPREAAEAQARNRRWLRKQVAV
jgi:inosose dehydratase